MSDGIDIQSARHARVLLTPIDSISTHLSEAHFPISLRRVQEQHTYYQIRYLPFNLRNHIYLDGFYCIEKKSVIIIRYHTWLKRSSRPGSTTHLHLANKIFPSLYPLCKPSNDDERKLLRDGYSFSNHPPSRFIFAAQLTTTSTASTDRQHWY